MGSVSYRKVGSRWHIRFRHKGDEKIKSFAGELPEYSIERKARWFKEEWERGYFDPFEEETIETSLVKAIEEYCHEKHVKGKWNVRTTKISRQRLQKAIENFGEERTLTTITRSDFQNLINNLDLSAQSKRSYLSTIQAFLKWCDQQNYLSGLYELSLPSEDRRELRENRDQIQFFSYRDLKTISRSFQSQELEKMNARLYKQKGHRFYMIDIWWLMFWQMLRKSEVPRLRMKDISEDGTRIRIKSGSGKTDVLPLVPPARKIVRRYFEPEADKDQPLFGIRSMKWVYEAFKTSVQEVFPQRDSGLHQLRHGGIIHYLKLAKPVQYVSQLARHSTPHETLRIYKEYIPDKLEESFSDIKDEGPGRYK